MPRMNPDNIDGELNICDVDDSCTPGVRFASCETLSTPFSCRAAPEKAATAIGTCWTFSARRCAVTTMSPMPTLDAGSVLRSGERLVGQECVSTGSVGCCPYILKKK